MVFGSGRVELPPAAMSDIATAIPANAAKPLLYRCMILLLLVENRACRVLKRCALRRRTVRLNPGPSPGLSVRGAHADSLRESGSRIVVSGRKHPLDSRHFYPSVIARRLESHKRACSNRRCKRSHSQGSRTRTGGCRVGGTGVRATPL